MVNFLKKLYQMVTDEEDSDVIRWENGAVLIISPQGLIDTVLMKFFRHNNYTSFQRQLNYFGFKKVAGSRNKNSAAVYVNSDLDQKPAEAILTCKKRSGRGPGLSTSAAADGGHHRHRKLLRQQSASAPELLGKRAKRGAAAAVPRAMSTDAGSYHDGYSSNIDQDYGSEDDEEEDDAEMGYYEAPAAATSQSSHRAAATVTAAALPCTLSKGSTVFGALSPGDTASVTRAAIAAAESCRGAASSEEQEPVNSADSPDMPAPTTELCFPSDFKNPKAAAAAMADACTEAEQAAATHGASELFQPRRGGRGRGGNPTGLALSLNIRPDGLASSFSSYCAAPHGGRALLTPRGLSIRAPRSPRSPGSHRTPRTPVPVSRREDGWPTDSRFSDMLPGGDFLGADSHGAPYPSPFEASLPSQASVKWEEQSYDPAAGTGGGSQSPMRRGCERDAAASGAMGHGAAGGYPQRTADAY